MARDMSYGHAAWLLHHVRHERDAQSTPVTTAAVMVDAVKAPRFSTVGSNGPKTFPRNRTSPPHDALRGCGLPEEAARLPHDTVEDAVSAYHGECRADCPIAVPEAQPFPEDPARTVTVSIDDVGMVTQVPKRCQRGAASSQKAS